MGRHETNYQRYRRPDGPRWQDPYYKEWSVVVGDRIRRLRTERGWTLHQLTRKVPKPDGASYSAGYFSRLERGFGSAPLYVYIVVAEALEVEPGVLLGPDEVQREVSGSEVVLLDFVRAAELGIGEAIARLAELGPRRSRPGGDGDRVQVDHAAQ